MDWSRKVGYHVGDIGTKTDNRSIELRRFLYLDDDLVTEFIAQLEEGAYDDYSYQQAAESGLQGGGQAGVSGIGIGGSAGRSAKDEVSFTRTLTPASRFAKLVRLLREGQGVEEDPARWATLRRGAILLADAAVDLSGVTRIRYGFKDFERSDRLVGRKGTRSFAPLIRAARRLARTRQESDWTRRARELEEAERGAIPVILVLPGDDRFTILSRLDQDCLRVEPTELVGPARVLVKLSRLLSQGEIVETADPFPAIPSFNVSFREGLSSGTSDNAEVRQLIGPLVLEYPGGVATAVAIYQ